MSLGNRFRELIKKYGKVALGVHLSVSAASITGLYVAINNNVDVEKLLEKFHLSKLSKPKEEIRESEGRGDTIIIDDMKKPDTSNNRTTELIASTGGALTLAILCNKALLPVRIPITIALTPPVSRFLAKRKIIKNRVQF